MVSNSQRSTCLCLLSAGIKGVCHHHQAVYIFFNIYNFVCDWGLYVEVLNLQGVSSLLLLCGSWRPLDSLSHSTGFKYFLVLNIHSSFSSSTWESEAVIFLWEFQSSLVYKASSRIARAIQRNPVLKKAGKQANKPKFTQRNLHRLHLQIWRLGTQLRNPVTQCRAQSQDTDKKWSLLSWKFLKEI